MSNIIINVKTLPYYEGTKDLDGSTYILTINWNTYTEKWYLNLKGVSNDVEINGMALLPGKDLLAPYGYLVLGQLWVIDNSNANDNPDYDGFGTRWTLEYTPLT